MGEKPPSKPEREIPKEVARTAQQLTKKQKVAVHEAKKPVRAGDYRPL